MDRLIFKVLDPSYKLLTAIQRVTARKAKKQRDTREADSYRGAKRNARSHVERTNPSLGKGYRGPAGLNRSRKWKYAETYHDGGHCTSQTQSGISSVEEG